MKQNILIATLLAGMLALAGCGGGSSSDGSGGNGKDNDTNDTLSCGPGTTKNSSNQCVRDTAAETAMKARTDALALYNAIKPLHSTNTGLASAMDDDKETQNFKGEGAVFSANTPGIASKSSVSGKSDYFNVERNTSGVKVTGFPAQTDPKEYTATNTVTGTFLGVSGTFECFANDGFKCTSQSKGDAGFALSASWRFKPDDPKAKVEGPTLVEWGWWVDDIEDVESAQAGYRAVDSATDTSKDRDISGLSSTATYTGTALGKYAVVDKDSSDSGHFTATAKLTADFDDDMLTGTIDAFKDADNGDLGWTVELESEMSSTIASVAASNDDNSVVWTRDGDDVTTENGWLATAYGGSSSTAPGHIIGEFEADHFNAKMIGAFGTEKDKQN